MTSPELVLLDVGHGNCALARDGEYALLIDAPPKWTTIRDTFRALNVERVSALFVSHQDRDHFSGAIPLLLDEQYRVDNIFVNPDASKPGAAAERRRVRAAMTKAVDEGRAKPPDPLSTKQGTIEFGTLRVEVLGPPWDVVSLTSAGGTGEQGEQLTGHTLSGVLRIGASDGPTVLLPGDLDSGGLDDLLGREVDLRADWLVYPHHGGHVADADDAEFASRLCTAVAPKTVVFSHSRAKYENPLPEVVAAVRAVVPDVRIACTQFSRNCANMLPDAAPGHLVDLPAAGRAIACCAGTLRLALGAGDGRAEPDIDSHRAFIEKNADAGALCLEPLPIAGEGTMRAPAG